MPNFSVMVQYDELGVSRWEYWGEITDVKDEHEACAAVKELDPNVIAVESKKIEMSPITFPSSLEMAQNTPGGLPVEEDSNLH